MKNVPLYIDIAFCFVFLPAMLFVFPVERWWGAYPVFFGLFIGWLYATYFVYKYLVIPRLFLGGRRRLLALAAVAVSLLITLLFSSYEITSPYYHLRQLYTPEGYPLLGIRTNQQAVWLHYILVVVFGFAVGTLNEAYRQRLAREEMEYERNRAELALYKAQINPHFLFNTLNTLYGLLITRSERAEAMMERFINLVKYMYNNANQDFIALSEEVRYIDQYLDLQKLRLNEFAEVTFTYEVEMPEMSVPPMMLITFVENAFKYGISSNDPCFVRIHLSDRGGRLRFEVENSVFERASEVSAHTGIENCRKRLSLLYPGRYRLDFGRGADGVFRLLLEIESPAV